MPKRSGTPSTRSMPFCCSRKIRSIVSWPSRRMPSISPPRATTDMILATERAFPCPFAAPMSARRQPGVLATPASTNGPVTVALRGADLEVGAQRPGDFLGHELLERLAADPPQDLAEQVPVVERVVA